MRFLRSAIVLLAICLPCVGQQPEVAGSTENVVEVAPYKLVQIQAKEGQFVWVLPWSGDWDEPPLIELHTLESGNIGWVGPPGRYAILWHHDGGQGQSYVVITSPGPAPPPGPGPEPPDPPDPTPTPRPGGFAGRVYDLVKQADDATTAKSILDNFRMIARKIRDGELKRAVDVAQEIKRANNEIQVPEEKKEAWRPFALFIVEQANEIPEDPAAPATVALSLFDGIAKGIAAAYDIRIVEVENAVAR